MVLTRMQPISNVFNKFPRIVQKLAGNLQKKVMLVNNGKDVELDKTLIETISDPLLHLIRYAVMYSIELPSVRRKSGKNEGGRIVLSACHEAGQVSIEIKDDGKGIDGNSLAMQAVNKGLLTADQAQLMSAKEKVDLIFLEGLSVFSELADGSGCDIGMDVIKADLNKLGANLNILSEVEKGTTVSISLPHPLAIIPCRIIRAGEEWYAIQQVDLDELLGIPNQVKERIDHVCGYRRNGWEAGS